MVLEFFVEWTWPSKKRAQITLNRLDQGWAIILPQGPNEKPTLLPRANQHFVTRYQKDKTRCHSTNSRCRLVNFKHHVCELGQWSTHAHVISSQYVSISVFEWVFIHYLVINWPHKWNIADLLRATQNHQEGPWVRGSGGPLGFQPTTKLCAC